MTLRLSDIFETVAEFYKFPVQDMYSPARERKISHPRQLAFYLARKMTTKSLPDIGRFAGGRDHTTVLHGVRAVKMRIATDKEYANQLQILSDKLELLAEPIRFFRRDALNFISRRANNQKKTSEVSP